MSTTPTLSVKEMAGIFYILAAIHGIGMACALLGHMWRSRDKRRGTLTKKASLDELAMMTDGEMLRKVYETVVASEARLMRATSEANTPDVWGKRVDLRVGSSAL